MAEPDAHERSDPPAAGGKRPGKSAGGDVAAWYRLTGIGFEFIAAVGLFVLIGWALDRWLDTRPWLTLVGGGLGFAVGLWNMVRAANKSFRR